MVFLSHHVLRNNIAPLPKKLEAVQKMTPPASLRDLQVFIVIVR